MRDFDYDPKAVASEAEEKGKLELQLKKQFVSSHWPSYVRSKLGLLGQYWVFISELAIVIIWALFNYCTSQWLTTMDKKITTTTTRGQCTPYFLIGLTSRVVLKYENSLIFRLQYKFYSRASRKYSIYPTQCNLRGHSARA